MTDTEFKTDMLLSTAGDGARRRAVAYWLFATAALVLVMIVVGGITRLTESGLSMVHWQPITRWLPPLTEAAWLQEFEHYKQYPEYQKVNHGMSLDEFKAIFAWEFGHRLLGRVIGLVYFLPMVAFLFTGRIKWREAPWFLVLLVLGGSQGALGWFMVKSGLVDRPDVSQYRLAAHLSLAVFIYVLLIWTGLKWWFLSRATSFEPLKGPVRTSWWLLGLLSVQIVLGAFVAGTNAGFQYNTFPLMDGSWIPDGLFVFDPAWMAPFEDRLTIQFLHRKLAYVIAIFALAVFVLAWGGQVIRTAFAVLCLVFVQIVLGILTLIYVVPVSFGALHQAGALVVLTAIVYLLFSMTASGRRDTFWRQNRMLPT